MLKRSKTKTLKEWEDIFQDWERSGLGTYTYCKMNNINYSVFHRWQCRIKPYKENRSIRALKKWETLIEEWQESGLGIAAFCKQKNISCRESFYKWVKKICPLYIKASEKCIKKWESIIEDWKKSGLNKSAYCKAKGLKWPTFYRWEKKLNPSHKPHSEKTKAKWSAIIEDWKKSGLSANAYILENELTGSFYLWKRRLYAPSTRESMHREARERWTTIIEDWKQSGLNRYAYCKKKGRSLTVLYRWERILNPEGVAQRLSKMKKEPCTLSEFSLKDLLVPWALGSPFLNKFSIPSRRIEVMLAQRHRLTLEGNFDERQLSSFLTPLLKR